MVIPKKCGRRNWSPVEIEIREVDVPVPGPGEVLIRVEAWDLRYGCDDP